MNSRRLQPSLTPQPKDLIDCNRTRHFLKRLYHSRAPNYSARIQTVDPQRNPAFYDVLRRFFALTGCPVLINTSFNVRGEPIVCTPTDAVQCFINTGIDVLAIGAFLVFKEKQSATIRALEGTISHELD